MNNRDQYFDLHCHPALKPFGHSFNRATQGIQSKNRAHKRSLWFYNPPSLTDKLLNYAGGLTKFSQSDMSTLARGGVSIACVSLYPLERPFVRNELSSDFVSDLLVNLATGVGDRRIDYLQTLNDYYADLESEYNFYLQCDGRIVSLPEGRHRYQLVRNYREIREISESALHMVNQDGDPVQTICLVPTIEGLHVLNSNVDGPAHLESFLENLERIRAWAYPPFFITVAHHFWNHICGHAPSLSGLVARRTDQSTGLGTGFTGLGREVLRSMIAPVSGPRILPDLKHMSPEARKDLYAMRNSGYLGPKDFPLIVSHGACNGLLSFDNPVPGPGSTAALLRADPINFYDEEILTIAESGGLIGLQLDERRIASRQAVKSTPSSVHRNQIMHYRSALLWLQVRHIAETLDRAGRFAWDCMAIGSDFDGIIDSLNGFWTAKELPFLADFLERHAYNYMKTSEFRLQENHIAASEIIHRIFSGNGKRFLQDHFSG